MTVFSAKVKVCSSARESPVKLRPGKELSSPGLMLSSTSSVIAATLMVSMPPLLSVRILPGWLGSVKLANSLV